jgi:hypothetical protein
LNTFSYRAECKHDSDLFLESIKSTFKINIISEIPDPTYPDIEVEFNTDANSNDLENSLVGLTDTHVIWETLGNCHLSDNSLERNYDKPVPKVTKMAKE